MNVGDIYRHERFYADLITGQLLPKYLIVLAFTPGGDIVARLLTSQHDCLRPEQPRCHHGDPYPGFFIGIPGGLLSKKTWIDLRAFDDLDADIFLSKLRKGLVTSAGVIEGALLRAAMECAAGADDTTRHQERHIRDALAQCAS